MREPPNSPKLDNKQYLEARRVYVKRLSANTCNLLFVKKQRNQKDPIEPELFEIATNDGVESREATPKTKHISANRTKKKESTNPELDSIKLAESVSWRREILQSEMQNRAVYDQNDLYIVNGDILQFETTQPLVDLVITSPPYNLNIEYKSNNDKLEYSEYLDFSFKWLKKCFDLAQSGGRLCLNIPLDKNKGGMQSIYADLIGVARKAGWNYFTSIVWNEGNISRRTAWGSWMSASAPYVIAPVEMVVVFYKNQWKKSYAGKSTIERDEFMYWTNGLWTFNGESKKRVGHPAPFPIELPDRCIKLFSYEADVVFDPFLGSGTTLIAALMNKRIGFGLDIDKSYCDLSRERITKITEQIRRKSDESTKANLELF